MPATPEHDKPPFPEVQSMLHKLASGEWQATIFAPDQPARAENFTRKADARAWLNQQ